MSATFATVDVPEVDFRRDRWNRPLIGQLDGSKPKPYTRCSSAAKAIEDTFALEQWAQRNVAYGMAHDSSLVARVLAVGGNPGTWSQAEKAAVKAVVADAQTTAKAHKAADIGTAIHRMTELADRGEAFTPGPYAADLAAYQQALLDGGVVTHPAWVECRIISDTLQMAGTADRIVTLAQHSPLRRALECRDDEAVIADIKSGGSVDFGALSFAAQLAAYASGCLYDPVADVRLPTPLLNRKWGLVIHVPAGSGTAALYKVDLVEGLRAAHLANAIRHTRKASKGWLKPAMTTTTGAPT